MWRHYEYQPSFVLGFHGCDIDTANNLISGKTTHLKHSENNYDWLGHGIYFWEGDPTRTHEWALASHKKPAVLGAIIDLRHCLDLFNRQALEETRRSHEALIKALTGPKLFKTANIPANNNKRRNLDCAVFQFLHAARKNNGEESYDSVGGPFLEGALYKDTEIQTKNHIQLCVRDPSCIKDYFKPIATL